MDLTLKELIELGADTPVLIVMAYFIYQLKLEFTKLSTKISTFMGMPDDDDK